MGGLVSEFTGMFAGKLGTWLNQIKTNDGNTLDYSLQNTK